MSAIANRLSRPSRRTLAVAAIAAVGLLVCGGVIAFFTAGAEAGSGGAARAGILDAGHTPTASKSVRDVTVSWSQNSPSFLGARLGAQTNGGYLVTRHAASDGNTPITPGASCNGLRQGGGDPLTCTEAGLATGRWQYTVTPEYYNWLGTPSADSASVVIAPNAPLSITLTNGLGQGNAYINGANVNVVNVNVAVPGTSLSTDTVKLSVSDGVHPNLTATRPTPQGAGTVSFTGLDVSGLNDGPLTFSALAESSYGDDSAAASSSSTKDTVAPVVQVAASRTADLNGWYNHAVTFSASTSTDTGGSGIDSCDPDLVYSGPDTATGSLTFHCTDKAGNSGTSSASFKYDSTKPSSTASGNDASWHASAVTVHLAATDPNGVNGSGVARLTYTVDGGAPQILAGDAGDVVVAAPSDHSNDGQHTMVFYASDNAANDETPSNSATVKIDTTKPQTTATGADANWHNAPVTVHLASVDPGYPAGGSGVVNLHYQVDGGSAVDVAGAGGVASADVTIAAPTNGSNDGVHTVSYRATDAAGNVEATGSTTVEIDTQKPATSATGADASWHSSAVTVHLAGSDPGYPTTGSGVASLRYRVDAAAPVDTAGSSGTASVDVTIPAPADGSNDGAHTISYFSTDAAGNVEATGSVTVKIDATKPTISASAKKADTSTYVSNTWTNQTVTVSYSCADTGGSLLASCTADQVFSATGVTASTSGTATDNAGNSNTASFGPIKIDKVTPSPGSFTLPAVVKNGQALTNAATDGNAGVASIQYLYCAGAACTPSISIGSSSTGPSYSVTWSSQPADGNYRVLARVTDVAGNIASSTIAATTVDNTPPSVAITSVNGSAVAFPYTTTNVTSIGGTCTSADGAVSWSIGPRSGSASCTAAAWSSGSFVALPAGSYTANASQTDAAGNVGNAPAQSVTVSAGATIAGIVLSNITTAPVPALTCSGPVGTIACSSTGEGNGSGNVLTATLTLVDQFQNPVTNTGSAIGIDLAVTGQGGVSPAAGANVLSIANGASTTSASFTLTRSNGNNKSVTLTATVHGTSQTVTITLSS